MKTMVPLLLAITACSPSGAIRGPSFDSADTADTAVDTADTAVDTAVDTADTAPPSPCAAGMVLVADAFCMDRYEAPNVAGADPLVMLTFTEAEAWCGTHGKRLCYDDEWLSACEGPAGDTWPYGNTHEPGRCNDEEVWRTYSQSTLSGWPYGLPTSTVETLDDLLDLVRAQGTAATAAADHIAWLYQGEGSGDNPGCVGAAGVYDLLGNVEEWTRRRDGGTPDFHGNLKGRYWSEPRTCQSNVTTHGDAFRFYEIGFRCCSDPE